MRCGIFRDVAWVQLASIDSYEDGNEVLRRPESSRSLLTLSYLTVVERLDAPKPMYPQIPDEEIDRPEAGKQIVSETCQELCPVTRC